MAFQTCKIKPVTSSVVIKTKLSLRKSLEAARIFANLVSRTNLFTVGGSAAFLFLPLVNVSSGWFL